MKKVSIFLGLGLVAAAGFLVVRSRLLFAPQALPTEQNLIKGTVESISAPAMGESPKIQETLPAPENPQTPPSSPPPSSVLLDQELPVIVPAPQPVADFLVAVRDLTDQIQMSSEETAALSAFGNADQLLPEAILSSLETKAQRGQDEVGKLVDLSETVEIKSSLLQLYSSQVAFYKVYRQQNGKNEPVDLKELIRQWYALGVKCDDLRASLHQKYGLGRL
ncbi:MAG: hypothetical protein Q8N84_02350 [bacterium]|nr:hypothetical protein [bacterium]